MVTNPSKPYQLKQTCMRVVWVGCSLRRKVNVADNQWAMCGIGLAVSNDSVAAWRAYVNV
jgi:hypothetical protein